MLAQLRQRPEVRILAEDELAQTGVAWSSPTPSTMSPCACCAPSSAAACPAPRTVVIASTLDDAALVAAAEAGVLGVLRRRDATTDGLARAVVRVAGGSGEVPEGLLGRLLDQVGRL